jgi:hypothetical protein
LPRVEERNHIMINKEIVGNIDKIKVEAYLPE